MHNIIKRFKESGGISVRKGQGRKPKLNNRDLRSLRRHCIENRHSSISDITTWAQDYFGKPLSSTTIRRVNPISLSYPLPLSFARSCESKGCPNSRFDRGVGLRGSGRYPLKPSIFASLLETKGYPEHTAQPATMSARSSRESHFRLK